MNIEGKSALITGAAGGIGRAIAVALAERGAGHITLCDIDDKGLEETAVLVARLGSAASKRVLDVADYLDCERVFVETSHQHGLDIVVNNAGVVAANYPDMALAKISRLVSINLNAVIVGTTVAARLMTVGGGGVIINTASMAAFQPRLADAPYRASKAGVVTFTQCCGELAEQGVRVNAIAPGITDTPMLDKAADGPDASAWLESVKRNIHIRAPEEMAAGVVSLIEDDSKAGEILELNHQPR